MGWNTGIIGEWREREGEIQRTKKQDAKIQRRTKFQEPRNSKASLEGFGFFFLMFIWLLVFWR
jgi:hypothetical protein